MRRPVVQRGRVSGLLGRHGVRRQQLRKAGALGPAAGRRQGGYHRHEAGRVDRTRGTPYVPSPLLYGDSLYFLGHYQGILSRVNAQTGKDDPGPFRLAGLQDVYASPVGAAGRIYITDRDGTTLVISHAAKLKVLAENRLDDRVSASAAIAGRELFVRGERY